jgi:DNA-directed RNA polymerase subunit RPC12/RpoP
MEEKAKVEREARHMTRVGQEIIECFGCGKAFKRTTVLDIDPHDTRVLEDDAIVRAASAIRCPHCGYEETRPLRARGEVQFPR